MQAQYITVMDIHSYDTHINNNRLIAHDERRARAEEGELVFKINSGLDFRESITGIMDDCNRFLRGINNEVDNEQN